VNRLNEKEQKSMHVEINNFSMAYEENGSGLPIVMVHGYPLNRKIWQPQLEGLSDLARLIAPDLRGHGESQPLPGPYWMDLLAQDIKQFLDALRVPRPFILCGLSMGGYVAMAYYRQYSPELAGLIFAATRAKPDSAAGKKNRDQAAAKAQREGVSAVVESMLPKLLSPKTLQHNPELVDRFRDIMKQTSLEAILGDLMGMKERPDSIPTLEEILLPTLIVYGEDDQVIGRKEIEDMHEALTHSQLVVIPEAGHLLNMEQPQRFNQAVRGYLESLGE
jgi:3-oxoadipate enol-lactonase